MKIDYSSTKWNKEVDRVKKILKDIGGDYKKNEETIIEWFMKSYSKDYLLFYNSLYYEYMGIARCLYLSSVNVNECKNYIYLSGLALIYVKTMHESGTITNNSANIQDSLKEIDYALYQMIACDKVNVPYLKEDDNNLISFVLHQKYEKAKEILYQLPDEVDDSKEVYYVRTVFLKKIYLAIINQDEKGFNEELAKRIKKYRKNMVGYSTIIDIVSIALIKMAKLAGIKCTIDVIEIPKMFFDETYVIDKETVKLPFYDEFLELGLIDM